jgi:hypothetical protein
MEKGEKRKWGRETRTDKRQERKITTEIRAGLNGFFFFFSKRAGGSGIERDGKRGAVLVARGSG